MLAGSDYVEFRDRERLSEALDRVFMIMIGEPERWFTLEELANLGKVPLSSVGSYISYIRRDKNWSVPKRYINNGLWEYQLGERIEARKKRMRPIGNPELFGEMMKNIYAYSAQPDLLTYSALQSSSLKWALDFSKRV